MLYRKIPRTGDELSILGFGCMRLPEKDGMIDEKRATRQIHYALDHGVNYVDTAWPYHSEESERFLGRALAGRRESVRLATKLPSWMVKSREDMDRILNAQLSKLATDRIDYYLLHALNGLLWDNLLESGVMDFLDKAREDGRIVNTGFSFHGTLVDFKRIVDARPWEMCLIQYNYLDEENQAGKEGLRYAASRELGVVVMEPLRGGNLGLAPPPAVDAIWKEAPRSRSPVEWALRWVWSHPEVVSVLSGMNEEAHVEENLAIAGRAHPDSLSNEELDLVRRASETYRKLMKVDCTGCGYCKPCPEGVNIPNCFEVYNKHHMFGVLAESKVVYAIRMSGMIAGEPGYASQCARCGECIEKCPQGLEIPELLEAVAEELEGPDLKENEALGRQILNIK